MAFRWRADDGPALNAGLAAMWFFRGSVPVLLRNPIFVWFVSGGGGGANQLLRFWYLSHVRAVEAQTSLRICTVSLESFLIAYVKYGCRWSLWSLGHEVRHTAPKYRCACMYYLFILDTGKQVIWQKVKTQMKCRINRHFIRVCNLCQDETEIHHFIENLTGNAVKHKKENSIHIDVSMYGLIPIRMKIV